jgi:hypothetical protein
VPVPLPPDRHVRRDAGHAGAAIRGAIDLHQAILAHAHATKQAAFGVGSGVAQTPYAVRRQRGRKTLPGAGQYRFAFEADLHKIAHARSLIFACRRAIPGCALKANRVNLRRPPWPMLPHHVPA